MSSHPVLRKCSVKPWHSRGQFYFVRSTMLYSTTTPNTFSRFIYSVASLNMRKVCKAAFRPDMILQRVSKNYGWTPTQFDMIDWKAHHGKVSNSSKDDRWVFHNIEPSQSITCNSYIYRCPARWDRFLRTTLGKLLQSNHTCPQLAHTLLESPYYYLQDRVA